MPEVGERMKQVSVEFKWEHPANGCPNRINFRFIKRSFTAAGIDIARANRYAMVLAENSPQICDACKADYIFRGKT